MARKMKQSPARASRAIRIDSLDELLDACAEILPDGWCVHVCRDLSHEVRSGALHRRDKFEARVYSPDFKVAAFLEAPTAVDLYRKFVDSIPNLRRQADAATQPPPSPRSEPSRGMTLYTHAQPRTAGHASSPEAIARLTSTPRRLPQFEFDEDLGD